MPQRNPDDRPSTHSSEVTDGPMMEEPDLGAPPSDLDDAEDQLADMHNPVPGAVKRHHKAHAMNKGETKHKGV